MKDSKVTKKKEKKVKKKEKKLAKKQHKQKLYQDEKIKQSSCKVNDDDKIIIETVPLQKKKRRKLETDINSNDDEKMDSSSLCEIVDQKQQEDDCRNDSKTSRFPYLTDDSDHCETPLIAYQHVKLALEFIFCHLYQERKNTNKRQTNDTTFTLWDPFYCNGAAKRHLLTVLKNVEKEKFVDNRKKRNRGSIMFDILHEPCDFYKLVQTSETIPHHDMMITNPPYSGSHIEKLFTHCHSKYFENKPFALLLPNWVARKKEYKTHLIKGMTLIYLTPVQQTYTYVMPEWAKRPGTHVQTDGLTTPYHSSWYLYAGNNDSTLKLFDYLIQIEKTHNDWVVAKTIKGLKWKLQKKGQR